MSNTHTDHLSKITGFINDIGITCHEGEVRNDSFLPGVDIQDGEIIYNPAVFLSAGDLLHEAGHIAVLSPKERATVSSPDVRGDLGEGAELAAIAWSWAALKFLDIPPDIVFHEQGYKEDSQMLIQNFSNEKYLGVSLLDWLQMTADPYSKIQSDKEFFPIMSSWLRPG